MVARRKRIVVETDNSNWKAPKKRRKPRKPMSEEQRVASAARLEKAREIRKAKTPDYGMSNVHLWYICLILHMALFFFTLNTKWCLKSSEWLKIWKWLIMFWHIVWLTF